MQVFRLYDISRHGGFCLVQFQVCLFDYTQKIFHQLNPVHTTNLHLFARLCLSLCLQTPMPLESRNDAGLFLLMGVFGGMGVGVW